MADDVTRRIRDFIQSDFVFDDSVVSVDASLVDSGLIDSTGILEMVLFLEEAFGIAVEDDEVLPDNFDSVTKLAAYVGRKTAGRVVIAGGSG